MLLLACSNFKPLRAPCSSPEEACRGVLVSGDPSPKEADQIEQVKRYYQRVDAEDLNSIVEMFSEEAIYERGELPAFVGRSRIATFFRQERKPRGITLLIRLA